MTLSETWAAFRAVIGPTLAAIAVLVALARLGLAIGKRSTAPAKKTVHGTLAFLTAFAALGVTTGFAAGDSRAPAIGAMLPAVLGVVSGLLTYLFSKDSLSDWRPIIPAGVTVLVVGGLIGLSFGSTLRGKSDQYEKDYAKYLIRYQYLELETQKAKYLAELELWKANELSKVSAAAPKRAEDKR